MKSRDDTRLCKQGTCKYILGEGQKSPTMTLYWDKETDNVTLQDPLSISDSYAFSHDISAK